MPKSAVLEIPPEEQAQMLAALRRARYGDLLALHILLWCAVGRNPYAPAVTEAIHKLAAEDHATAAA
jgi:hypothetical protein